MIDLDLLDDLTLVLSSPPGDAATLFSRLLMPVVSHSALLIMAVDDVGRPLKKSGDTEVTGPVTLAELDALRMGLAAAVAAHEMACIGGVERPVLAVLARTGAILVLTDPGTTMADRIVSSLWEAFAMRIQQRANEASPTYLMESRAVASVRTEVVTELADTQSATLDSLLTLLRSPSLDDRSARLAATNLATEAAVHLRTSTDRVLTFTEEPVASAFERLREDLRPLFRYRELDVQFVEPPIDGRALPSEVAHGARAVVRGAILALVDQNAVGRVRVQWDCDGTNLLINVRDDGPGELTVDSVQLQPLRRRVMALDGTISVEATTGWGSEMSVVMPLDPPTLRCEDQRFADLSAREREVVERVISGMRNKSIATDLGISQHTVKFHVAKIFRKMDVSSRAELVSAVLGRVNGQFVVPAGGQLKVPTLRG